MTDDQTAEPTTTTTSGEVRVRRAPRFATFIVLGAIVGVIVAVVLALVLPSDPTTGSAGAFVGFFALMGLVVGIGLGAIVALVVDAVSRSRAATRGAEVTTVEAPPLEGELED